MKIHVKGKQYEVKITTMSASLRNDIFIALRRRIQNRYLPEINTLCVRMVNLVAATRCARAGLGTVADTQQLMTTITAMCDPLNKADLIADNIHTFTITPETYRLFFAVEGCVFKLTKGVDFIQLPNVPYGRNEEYTYPSFAKDDTILKAAYPTALELGKLIQKRDRDIYTMERELTPVLEQKSMRRILEAFPELIEVYPDLLVDKRVVSVPATIENPKLLRELLEI